MAQLLASLFSVSFNTVLIIFALCTLGSLVLRTQLEDPMISFAFQPVLAFLSVLVFAGLEASGFIEPIITTDWIKGILVASTMGIGIGIGLILMCVAKFEARSDQIETTLTKRHKQVAEATPMRQKRTIRTVTH
jgi:hypothetical protein